MTTLRCTQKLLRRFAGPHSEVPLEPTTVLGDWYANILFSKPQLVLCISEHTLLPVVLPAKNAPSLPVRFVAAVHDILSELGVAPQAIAREMEQMRDLLIGRTQSGRVLGSLNDFMFQLGDAVILNPDESLLQISLQLGEAPCSPIGYKDPIRATMDLFASV